MSGKTTSRDRTGEDPYKKLCRAMDPGLLITVNCSDPTSGGIDEMKVLRVDEDGDVHLRRHDGRNFVLTHKGDRDPGPAIKEVGDTEFSPIHDQVTTIEVVGIGD